MNQPFSEDQHKLNGSAALQANSMSINNWDKLRVFLAYARHGSKRSTGISLNISRQTVSRALKELEEAYHTKLINSNDANSHLTEAGNALLQIVDRANQEFLEIPEILKKQEQTWRKKCLRVSTTDGISLVLIAPHLNELPNPLKEIGVHLMPQYNYTNFEENHCDILITGNWYMGENVISEIIGTMRFQIFASKSYISQYGTPNQINLSNHKFIRSDLYSASGKLWSQWQEKVDKGKASITIDNPISYAAAVRSGVGIGLLSYYLRSVPELNIVLPEVQIQTPLFFHYPKKLQDDPSIKQFKQWFKQLSDYYLNDQDKVPESVNYVQEIIK